ncbi:MAG: riboflavin kinase/FMN adenylyltransferase [Sphingobacteriales bacterium]
MKIHRGLENLTGFKNAVVTNGTFDGVHIGHRKILSRIVEIAKEIDGETVLTTYSPHPRLILFPEHNDLRLINTLEEKIELISSLGIDHLVIIPFTKAFSRLTSEHFVEEILVNKIGTKKLVIGYDHHFGKNREGSFENLKAVAPIHGFEVEEIPKQDIDDVGVSSTKIRAALFEGDMTTANSYLGYDFLISGKVAHGDKIGRTIGFPTANIEVGDKTKIIPANGVYAVSVKVLNENYNAMMYIGQRPTLNGQKISIEVNIFDFDGDIYGEYISVNVLKRTREDEKFPSLESLKLALQNDERQVKNFFNK